MLSKKMQAALNKQINAEMWSAYLYLSMSMDAQTKGLRGVANWYFVQYLNEQDHGYILMEYLNAMDAKVTLQAISEVRTEWDSALDMFEFTLEHEKVVSSMINNLAVMADDEKDFATSGRLIWFVDKQIDEESMVREVIDALKAAGKDKFGLYMVDKELSHRIYKQASPLKKQD